MQHSILPAQRAAVLRFVFLLSLALATWSSTTPLTAVAQSTIEDLPVLQLPAAAQGSRALNAIGNRLPVWAAMYDMSVPEFARTLREDPYGFLDARGRLYFVEPDADQIPSANADMLSSATYPLPQTFFLESRPESSRTIFLDFDGHVIENTAWNANGSTSGTGPIVAQAWSRDSDRSSFSDSELADIQAIWRRVAEDFAPFDINVTTRDPGEAALARSGSGDVFFGTRVLFTPNTFYNCSCGGVAYVGTLDSTNSAYYQPALVFNSGVNSAAEAASHEVGHNGGLSHDGTSTQAYYTGHGSGATGWAPVMGVGYNRQLVQWSRGEYADANQTQDDYLVFASNRLPAVADDHGNSAQFATVASMSSNGVTAFVDLRGVIETPQDVDAFLVTAGAGQMSLEASPSAVSPNLDIGLSIFDSSGNLVGESNAADTLLTTISLDVPAGQYLLLIEGVGKGDPLASGYTDYGSLGGYVLAGQFADGGAVTPPSASIATPAYTPAFAPLSVSFDASASTGAARFEWDFGDGTAVTTTEPVTTHSYAGPGSFTVQLVVVSNENLTDSDSVLIDVINQAPIAAGSLDKTSVEAGEPISVADNGSYDPDNEGSIAAYTWEFGDGASATGATATHSFANAGSYSVSLTVTDDLGATDTVALGAVDVVLPSIVNSVATAGTSIAGAVSGDYSMTHAADGVSLRLVERMSGGKKRDRYSYAAYEFQMTLPPGQSTVRALGRRSASGDGDSFELSWGIGATQGQVGELATVDGWIESEPFVHTAGQLTITLADTNRAPGGSSLDSAYIDAIAVITDTTVDPGGDGGDGGDGGSGGDVGSGNLSVDLVGAWKVKGRNHVEISWTPAETDVEVFRNGMSLGVQAGGSFVDDQLGKGGMSLEYRVCDSSNCSPTLSVAF